MTMHFIASTGTFASNTASYQFTNIPQTYTHLQIRVYGRASHAVGSSYTLLQFNGDTAAANYCEHHLYGDGSGVASGAATNQTYMNSTVFTGASAASGAYGVAVMDIYDYTSTTKNKTITWVGGYDANGSGRIEYGSGMWYKTPEAITWIGLYTANILAGSRFDLYGITSSPTTGA